MQGMALADLAFHAGVQEIKVQPNGAIIPDASRAGICDGVLWVCGSEICKLGQCLVWDEGLDSRRVRWKPVWNIAGILIPRRSIEKVVIPPWRIWYMVLRAASSEKMHFDKQEHLC